MPPKAASPGAWRASGRRVTAGRCAADFLRAPATAATACSRKPSLRAAVGLDVEPLGHLGNAGEAPGADGGGRALDGVGRIAPVLVELGRRASCSKYRGAWSANSCSTSSLERGIAQREAAQIVAIDGIRRRLCRSCRSSPANGFAAPERALFLPTREYSLQQILRQYSASQALPCLAASRCPRPPAARQASCVPSCITLC